MADNIDLWRECKPPTTPLKKSYFHGACIQPLSGKTIGDVLDEEATLNPDRVAFRGHEFDEQLTTKQLKQKADNVSKALLVAKLKRGDLVLADCVTDLEYLSLYFGTLQVGLVFVSPLVETALETQKLCNMKPRAVFLGRKHYTDSLAIYKQYADSCNQKSESGNDCWTC